MSTIRMKRRGRRKPTLVILVSIPSENYITAMFVFRQWAGYFSVNSIESYTSISRVNLASLMDGNGS